MFKKYAFIGIAVLASVLMITGIGFAKDKANESTDKPVVSAEAQAAEDLALAGEVAEYGRRADNPLALVVAAQIMKNTPAKEEDRAKATEGKAAEESGQKSSELDTPDSLLAEAKAMAEEDRNSLVVGLVDKESKIVAQRGRVGGAIRHVDTVRVGMTDVYQGVRFRGGREAVVGVIGDGDCDLDLFVYDEGGNLIGSDTDLSDRCVVSWTPAWTGPFTIKVKNLGNVYAHYALVSN